MTKVSALAIGLVIALIALWFFSRPDETTAADYAAASRGEEPKQDVVQELAAKTATSRSETGVSSVDLRLEAPVASDSAVEERLLDPTFLDSVHGLARSIHQQQANLDAALDLAAVLGRAAARVEPVFDPLEGGLVYTIPSEEEGVHVQLIALAETAAMRDQFRMRISLPDAPGYRGPGDSVQGSEVSIHFNLADIGLKDFSAFAKVNVHHSSELRGHIQTVGPLQVGSVLSVKGDGAKWIPMTLDVVSENGQTGWLSATGEVLPALGNLSHPTASQLHSLFKELKPGAR